MSARRLSVGPQVHHQEAPTGGAVHVSCPPRQAGKQKNTSACVLSRLPPCPDARQAPASTSLLFHQDNSEIENLYAPAVTGTHTQTACPWAALPHTHTHTHVENRETRTKQEKRWKENSSGTAELSKTSFGLVKIRMEACSVPGEAKEPLPSPDHKNSPRRSS